MPERFSRENSEAHFHSPLEEPNTTLVLEPRVEVGEPRLRVEGQGAEKHLVLTPEANQLLEHALHQPEVHHHLRQLREEDPHTYEHTMSVARNAVALAWINRHLEDLNGEDISILAKAALLHDIGKLDLPKVPIREEGTEPVLPQNAERPLTQEERESMRLHPMLTVRRLQGDHPVDDPRVLALAVTHHQVQDNPTMRPDDAEAVLVDLGIYSKQDRHKLSVMQQLLEASDKFDALDSERPYKKALPVKETEEIMMKEFGGRDANLKFVHQVIALHHPSYYH